MADAPASDGDVKQTTARDALMALVGFLSMAASASCTSEQRVHFASAAERQARILREQLHGPFLLVLAREHAHQAERLRQVVGSLGGLQVIVDRRRAEPSRVPAVERRQEPKQHTVAEDLRRIGAALVPAAAVPPTPAPAAPAPPTPAAAVRPPSAPAAAPPVAATRGIPVKPTRSTPTRDPAIRCRVLLIDDDAAVVQMLTSYFADGKPGFAVEAALSGEKGLAKLQAHRPDVVLLDVSMPGMNGLEVLDRIRRIDPSIPVIMVTGASHQETSQALKNGAFAYIPKPFDFRYVDHLVNLATEQRPLPSESS